MNNTLASESLLLTFFLFWINQIFNTDAGALGSQAADAWRQQQWRM
jgi:hypothetical protein